MGASALPRMTSHEFIAWALARPEGERFELVEGTGRRQDAGTGGPCARQAAHLPPAGRRRCHRRVPACEVFIDGLAVQVDTATVYEPDVMLRCGPPLSGEMLGVVDPLVVVEVLSPASRSRDAGLKLADYFRIPSLRHSLIVATDTRTVIHHARDEAGTILTRILRDGPVRLDPPGLVLDRVFPTEPDPP